MEKSNPEFFSQALSLLPYGVAIYTAAGDCVYSNQKSCDLLGLAKNTFNQTKLFDLPFADSLELSQLAGGNRKPFCKQCTQLQNDKALNIKVTVDDTQYIYINIVDTTREYELSQALEENQRYVKQLDDAINGAGIGCWDFFPQEEKIVINKAWVTQKKYQDAEFRKSDELFSELIGGLSKWRELVHPDDLEITKLTLQRHLDGNTELYNAQFRMICGDGEWRWVHDCGKVFEWDEQGKPVRMNGVHIDITAAKHLESRIQHLLRTDALTNVMNRRYFESHVDQILFECRRDSNYIAFLLLDIDYFKQFNDTYGHLAGDRSLRALGDVINASLQREGDACFRLGGEEFAVIYQVDSKETALEIAQKVKDKIEDLQIPHQKNTASPYLTVSMGLWCGKVGQTLDVGEIYRSADTLLYSAKAAGRNTIESSCY